MTGAGVKTFIHTDKQGSVVAMSDTSGAMIEGPYIYDPYGNCTSGGSPCSSTGVAYRYTGRRFDAETGCLYYRARYYCPDDKRGGRFLQTDPVGYTVDLDLYTYAGNDPTNRTDPTGSCDPIFCKEDIGGIESINVTYSGVGSAANIQFVNPSSLRGSSKGSTGNSAMFNNIGQHSNSTDME